MTDKAIELYKKRMALIITWVDRIEVLEKHGLHETDLDTFYKELEIDKSNFCLYLYLLNENRWKGKDAYKRDDDNLVVKDYKMEMIKHEVLNSVMKDCFGEKMSRIPNFLGTEMMNSKLKKHGIGPRMGCKAQECYKVLNFQHMGNLREI